jgi:hypothetical protein
MIIYIYIYIYSEREQNCISESIWGSMGCGRNKENVSNEKYWNNPSIYEHKITHCTVSFWISGDHDDR